MERFEYKNDAEHVDTKSSLTKLNRIGLKAVSVQAKLPKTHSSSRIFNIGVLWACRLVNGALCAEKLNKMYQLKAYVKFVYILGDIASPQSS